MSGLKLLIEEAKEFHIIAEKREDGDKNLYIEGVFMVSDTKNKNGRLYPKAVMEKEVERYINEKVKNNMALGELNHPKHPNLDYDRTCHLIKELRMEGSNVVGKALVITEHPKGAILKALLNAGVNVGVSSRGLGSVKESKGLMEVQNDFHIITAADVVSDPSAPGAFVTGIMEETEYYYDIAKGTWIEKKVEQIKESIQKMNLREIEERKLRLFQYYLDGLKKLNQ